MLSLSPWVGLSEPGEACVKCGGKETALGAHAPKRGASPRNRKQTRLTSAYGTAAM